jgi:hypothetical protein
MADDPVSLNLHESREGRFGTTSAIGRSQGPGEDQEEDQEVGDGVELLHPHCAAVLRRFEDSKMRLRVCRKREREVVDVLFSERARLVCSLGVERLDEMIQRRELPVSCTGIIELFIGDLLALSR